jgi:hexokinase
MSFTAAHADAMMMMRGCVDFLAFCVQHFSVEITALVNDTTGTLASAQYGDARHNTDTCISIIVGTGLDAWLETCSHSYDC